MNLFMIRLNCFLHNDISYGKKYSKSYLPLYDHTYEYQNDWISGEVPWEFIELENIQYSNLPLITDTDIVKNDIMFTDIVPVNIITLGNININTLGNTNINTNTNTNFEKNIIIKAVVSGVMKGIYVQIVSIDNMITYTQCYTNKVIDMDIVLSLLYVLLYETNKLNEKEHIITLKKYNNIQLFEKYLKVRRNSMFVIIIMYILLFRGISGVE